MPSLVWSEALSLSMPVMDQTHQEFVELLAKAASSDDEHLVDRWQHLIAHTQDHFDREDAWMQASGFAPVNCHSTQHAVVLKVLKEGLAAGEQGSLNTIRMMAHELGIWFAQHAQTMDAALALHLKSVGFNPDQPDAAPARPHTGAPITSCAGQCHETVSAQATTAA